MKALSETQTMTAKSISRPGWRNQRQLREEARGVWTISDTWTATLSIRHSTPLLASLFPPAAAAAAFLQGLGGICILQTLRPSAQGTRCWAPVPLPALGFSSPRPPPHSLPRACCGQARGPRFPLSRSSTVMGTCRENTVFLVKSCLLRLPSDSAWAWGWLRDLKRS